MAKTAILLDPVFEAHDPGVGHPESITRYQAITAKLDALGVPEKCLDVPVREAAEGELLAAHTADYLRPH